MTNNTLTAGSVVILDEKAVSAVYLLRQARDLAETVKELEAEAKAILNEALPEGAHGVNSQGTVLIHRKEAKTSGFDREALKASYREAYEATYKETHYTKLVLV
jgi:hypothetical protein